MPGTFSESDLTDGKYIGALHASVRERVASIERQMILLHALENSANGRIDIVLKRIERLESALQDQQAHTNDLEQLHNKLLRDMSEQIRDAINELKTNGDKRPA
jgi:hypothetical protein